ncbi:MAG: lysylphosphatidylglycerol synthase domain-containing protein [Bacteroidota bacterium]
MLKSKKNKRILLFFAKLALFACVAYFFHLQLKKIDWMEFRKVSISSYALLFCVFILLIFNLLMEWAKWKNTLRVIAVSSKPGSEFRAFFAGILSGFLTPNLLGNFIGRIFYFERRERIAITYLTLVSNAAQFVASTFFGLLSILFIGLNPEIVEKTSAGIKGIVVLLILLEFIVYFQVFRISGWMFRSKSWMQKILVTVKGKELYLLQQLVYSLVRHAIFSFQYYFLLLSFGLKADLQVVFYIWQLFFISTLIPSLWLGKLFIRESVAIWILASFTGQGEIVLLASVVLWLINQGLPALIGVPYFKLSNRPVRA